MTTYDSFYKASLVAIGLTIGATALWIFAAPVTDGWLRSWMAKPPGVVIPLWQRLLLYFGQDWPKLWPAFVLFVWVLSFLPIELARYIKARRS